MKKLMKLVKNEDGSVLVLVALLLVVLIGFAAFVVDIGTLYLTKAKLQNAADAAALAGANDLHNPSTAESTAIYYAGLNGVQASETTPSAQYNGDPTKIKVVCTRTVPYTFARVLGFTETNVSAYAVAKQNSEWAGDALPFINLDDDYSKSPYKIEAWEPVTPGDFESIDKTDFQIINNSDPSKIYFKVNYMDGVTLKKGEVANKKDEITPVYDQHYPDKPVYVISLSSTVINSGYVKLKDGTYRSLSDLKDKDVIDLSQLVLLECTFDVYDEKAKNLFLTVLNVYNIADGELPPDYVNIDVSPAKLVE